MIGRSHSVEERISTHAQSSHATSPPPLQSLPHAQRHCIPTSATNNALYSCPMVTCILALQNHHYAKSQVHTFTCQYRGPPWPHLQVCVYSVFTGWHCPNCPPSPAPPTPPRRPFPPLSMPSPERLRHLTSQHPPIALLRSPPSFPWTTWRSFPLGQGFVPFPDTPASLLLIGGFLSHVAYPLCENE